MIDSFSAPVTNACEGKIFIGQTFVWRMYPIVHLLLVSHTRMPVNVTVVKSRGCDMRCEDFKGQN